jgi:hypothetical protein
MPFDDTSTANSKDTYDTYSTVDRNLESRQGPLQETIRLELEVKDPVVLAAIQAQSRGPDRDLFIERALRIGVLAINQATGQIDTHTLRDEGTRLLSELNNLIENNRSRTSEGLEGILKDYFNPTDGHFTQNVERLVRQDGDLQRVLTTHIQNTRQGISETIDQLVGKNSPIMQHLLPNEANTFFRHLTNAANQAIEEQNSRILRQFSLDIPESALNRLVTELKLNNTNVGTNLQDHITRSMREFSLDEENSALNRMLRQIQEASKQIQGEFTLDNEQSALARVRTELLSVMEKQNRSAQLFQERIGNEIAALNARRREARQGVQHGHEFEAALVRALKIVTEGSDDEVEAVGHLTGEIFRCRVGDAVITLGPDSAAPNARIVVEAKEAENYTLSRIREELQIARQNRNATYGIFVLSSDVVGAQSIGTLRRFDQDIVVVWNAEDRSTDIILKAAVLMAKGLILRATREREGLTADIDAMDRAISSISRYLGELEEVNTSASTIRNSSDKILSRTRIMRERIERELETLGNELQSLRGQDNA